MAEKMANGDTPVSIDGPIIHHFVPKGDPERIQEADGVRAMRFNYEDFFTTFRPDPSDVKFSEVAIIVREDNRVYISVRIDSQSDPQMNGPYNDLIFHTSHGDIAIERFSKFRWEGNTHFTKTFPLEGPKHVNHAFNSQRHPSWKFWW
jgi:hypothetical protein